MSTKNAVRDGRYARWVLPLTVVLAVACGASSEMQLGPKESPDVAREMEEEAGYFNDDRASGGGMPSAAPPPPARSRSPMPKSEKKDRLQIIRGSAPGNIAMDEEAADKFAADGDDALGPEESEQVREWFPEAFLWAPLVETSAEGTASLEVRVPDTLTTWRVLGLAHDREGQQAGTAYTFDSTLEQYVEPAVPGWLYSGDRLYLPVQVVNNTDATLDAALTVEASDALSGGGAATIALADYGSDVRAFAMDAVSSGTGVVEARLAGTDKVIKEIPVEPTGRPETRSRGGTLAGPRTFRLTGPDGADPATQELEVQVFAGPLSVVQAEIERVGGSGSWSGAYAFALADRMSTLAEASGAELDPKALRRLRIVGWQRLVKEARSPDAGVAADLLQSIKDVEGHQLAESLRDRLVRTVTTGQRADGTWARQSRGKLQQVLVQTAVAARSLPDGEEGARLRAAGAIERYYPQIEDPYTAAVVLSSGLVAESQVPPLEKLVIEGLSEGSDGARTLGSLPSGTLNAWGYRPGRPERLAFAILALSDRDDLAWRGDLVAELMAGYDADRGFGAGPADVVALEAVARSLKPLDGPVDVVLSLDGKEVSRASLDPSEPLVPGSLFARPGADDPEIELAADGAQGLAFRATLRSWVPWSGDERLKGVDVEVSADGLRAGRDGVLTLEVAAPSGTRVEILQGLPAGVEVDEETLRLRTTEAIGPNAVLASAETLPTHLEMTTTAFKAGEIKTIHLEVRPTYAGTFSTRPLTVKVAGQEADLPPMTWTVAP